MLGLFLVTTETSPFPFSDKPLYQPLIKVLTPDLTKTLKALQETEIALQELPQPTPPPTGGTTGFVSTPSHVTGTPASVRFKWGHAHRIDAISYVPAQKPDSFTPDSWYFRPVQLDFVLLLRGREVKRVSFRDIGPDAYLMRGTLPFFTAFPAVEADTVIMVDVQHQDSPSQIAVAEVYVFADLMNLAPLAELTAEASIEGMLGIGLDYICDDKTPLGLPQAHEPHAFVGYRTGPKPSADHAVWLEFSWPQSCLVDEVRLYPVERLLGVNALTAGFPSEVDAEIWDPVTEQWNTVQRYKSESGDTPGLNPVPLRFPEVETHRLRLNVKRLWKPSLRTAAALALAEVELRHRGRIVAADANIKVSDHEYAEGIQAAPGVGGIERSWRVQALMDGMSAEGRLLHERQWLQQLSNRADRIHEQNVLREHLGQLKIRADRYCWRLTLGLPLFSFFGLAGWLAREQIRHYYKIRRLRDLLAADLHDDLGSNLSAIFLYAERIKHQLGPNAPASFEPMLRLLRESLTNLKEMVSVTSPRISTSVRLVDRLKNIAEIHSTSMSWTFTVAADLESTEIQPTDRRSLRLFLKEALSNAVRHSGADRIHIELSYDDSGHVWLSVSDNGRGLPHEVLDNLNALSTLRLRAEEMKAHFKAENLPRDGCRIAVSLRVL